MSLRNRSYRSASLGFGILDRSRQIGISLGCGVDLSVWRWERGWGRDKEMPYVFVLTLDLCFAPSVGSN